MFKHIYTIFALFLLIFPHYFSPKCRRKLSASVVHSLVEESALLENYGQFSLADIKKNSGQIYALYKKLSRLLVSRELSKEQRKLVMARMQTYKEMEQKAISASNQR